MKPVTERLESSLFFLRTVLVRRYGEARIPNEEDVLVRDLLNLVRSAGGAERRPARKALDFTGRGLLLCFAVRSATRAVRKNDPVYSVEGIVALAVGGWNTDARDLQGIACTLYDSCRRLGIDPVPLFLSSAHGEEGGGAEVLKSIAGLSQDHVERLIKGSVRQEEDSDGFRYRAI